ncbi:MAG TPA: SufE family protein [Bacteroidales bacterium]|jgi:cysteine desulfuration protein SufE|nr:SufE family protein [Bacteroidales bacterium]HCM30040.1 Fe-S metabolism protein SufE [Bacteroidales bacterium]HOF07368.1 SufE family protein [Bacteroidales bacterium]HOJ24356.1 SufE family protein [Bacteroidales bacterium]HON97689.1 SufE family protein [Bacteroidales bacterium]
MNNIELKAKQIEDEFAIFDDWMDRYNILIDKARNLEALDPKYKTPQYLINGCQSQLWLYCENKDGRLFCKADGDAIITKGMAAIVLELVNGEPLQDIIDYNFEVFDNIGLHSHLSPTRSNGLRSLIKQVKLYAEAYLLKNINDDKQR